MEQFVADSRAIRFLDAHSLAINHRNLLFAYATLSEEGAVGLVPLVVQPPAPTPTEPAPIPTPDPKAPSRPGPLAWRNGKMVELTNPRPL